MLIFVIGCTHNSTQHDELHTGKYIEQTEGLSWLIIKKDHQFEFNRHIATSFNPKGTYTVEDNRLILTVDSDPKDTITFEIDDHKLIFENDFGDLLKKGAVFEYTDSEEEH